MCPNERSEVASDTSRRVALHLVVDEPAGRWLLEEEEVPESPLHDGIIEVLMLVLKEWARREARNVLVTSNLACRWDPADARVGVDPDVVLLEPPPPEGELTKSLRVWQPGHTPPRIVVEVVSENTAEKDYIEAAARCARLQANELWVLDPLRVGPVTTGGPFTIQIWRRGDTRSLERVYAGDGPTYSPELDAYVLLSEAQRRFRIAADPNGLELWPTSAEAEQARANTEQARAEAALAEVERLRRLLDQK